jgi:ankyrin repeat protein
LLRQCRKGDAAALGRVRAQLPPLPDPIRLADVQHVLAREHGSANWAELKRHGDPLESFLVAARGAALGKAKAYLAKFPEMAGESIHAACAIGDAEAVARHLKSDPSLVTEEHNGWPPLIYACTSPLNRLSSRHSAGITECVRLLLDAGADPNTFTLSDLSNPESRVSAAYRAVLGMKLGVLIMLQQRGADMTDMRRRMSEMQRGNIWAGVMQEHFKKPEVRHWLAEQTAEFNMKFETTDLTAVDPLRFIPRETPVFSDAALEMLRAVLERGHDPNRLLASEAATGEGQTMFHSLARIGNAEAAKLLLAHGADPGILNADGRSPLAVAIRAGNKEFAGVLRAHGASEAGLRPIDELLGACLRLDIDEARSVVKRHPNILDRVAPQDFEVMIQSVARNDLACVRLMVHCGFDPSGFGEAGATPLHIASWHGHVDMAKMLLEFHVPVNALDTTYRSSPLAWAIHGTRMNKAFLLSRPDAPKEYEPIIAALREAGGVEIPARSSESSDFQIPAAT